MTINERRVRQALDILGWGEPVEMPEGHPYRGINAHNGKTMQWLGDNWSAALLELRNVQPHNPALGVQS